MNIKYGWFVNDVVDVDRKWCAICAKSRVHEHYNGWTICIGCGDQNQPEAPMPALQLERFERVATQ